MKRPAPPGGTRRPSAVVVLAGLVALSLVASACGSPSVPPSPAFGPKIDPYAGYQGQTTCSATARPGVVGFRQLVMATYPSTRDYGINRPCGGGASEHYDGRAWDWGVNAGNASEKETADGLVAWLLETDGYGNQRARARRLGIMYIIWNHRVWKAYQPSAGWQPYTGSVPHTDHVHFSFGWPGANKTTTWWNPGASY